jgi:hypothetical protein
MNLFPPAPKFTSFVGRHGRSLMSLNPTLSNRTNNIVDSKADVAQLKLFLDILLRGLLEERKIDLIIFRAAPQKRSLGAISRGALGDALTTCFTHYGILFFLNN